MSNPNQTPAQNQGQPIDQETFGRAIEDVFKQVKEMVDKANAYGEAFAAVMEKGYEYVHKTILKDKLNEAAATLKLVHANVPEEIQEKVDEKTKEIEALTSEIRTNFDTALKEAELKDWLKFASQCKMDTRLYDEIDEKDQIVYDYILTKQVKRKDDFRTINTFMARKVIDVITEEQKKEIYLLMKNAAPDVPQRTDRILVQKMLDNLGVTVETMSGNELFDRVDKKYHPLLEWIVTNVKEYDSYIDETIDQFEEIELFTLTNARIEKYAEQYIVRFGLLKGVKDQNEGRELFEKYMETISALFKSVYKDKYTGF